MRSEAVSDALGCERRRRSRLYKENLSTHPRHVKGAINNSRYISLSGDEGEGAKGCWESVARTTRGLFVSD